MLQSSLISAFSVLFLRSLLEDIDRTRGELVEGGEGLPERRLATHELERENVPRDQLHLSK